MRIPILTGRTIASRRYLVPTAVKRSSSTSCSPRRYFPNQDPLGRRFGIRREQNNDSYEIVGVVGEQPLQQPAQRGGSGFLSALSAWRHGSLRDSHDARLRPSCRGRTQGRRCGRSCRSADGVSHAGAPHRSCSANGTASELRVGRFWAGGADAGRASASAGCSPTPSPYAPTRSGCAWRLARRRATSFAWCSVIRCGWWQPGSRHRLAVRLRSRQLLADCAFRAAAV